MDYSHFSAHYSALVGLPFFSVNDGLANLRIINRANHLTFLEDPTVLLTVLQMIFMTLIKTLIITCLIRVQPVHRLLGELDERSPANSFPDRGTSRHLIPL